MSEIRTAAAAKPDPIDLSIGSRLRLRRLALGLSQNTLAQSLGITFQQIQKYERGSNRIVASRLFHLARVLRVPVQYFFQDLVAQSHPPVAADDHRDAPSSPDSVPDLLTQRDTIRLIQAYNRIEDAGVRRQVYALVKTLGDMANPDPANPNPGEHGS